MPRHSWKLALIFLMFVAVARAQSPSWTALSATGGPSTDVGSSVVYDHASNRLILFGGVISSPCCTSNNDVWILTNANGSSGGASTWIKLDPATPNGAPSPRTFQSAVYDSAHNLMIVFGGGQSDANCGYFCTMYNDVWVLTNANGLGGTSTWMPLDVSGPVPAPREGHTAIYDPVNNRMIVFGGGNNGIMDVPNDLWALTNANGIGGTPQWIQLSEAGQVPPPVERFASFYDPASNRLTIFGGCCYWNNNTWLLTNANGLGGTPTWAQISPSGTSPSIREVHAYGYDPALNTGYIFGLGAAGATYNDVWALSFANDLGGTPTWTNIIPNGQTGSPPIGYGSNPGVYDPFSARLIFLEGPNSGEGGVVSPWALALNGAAGGAVSSSWAHTWGGSGSDSIAATSRDVNGNVYLAGSTSSFGAGGQDVLVLKYDEKGNLLWARTWGGSSDDDATAVAADPYGNVYVTGGTQSFGAGWSDVFLLKFDPSGNLLWSETWGGSSYDKGHDISFDSSGNVLVAAECYSYNPPGTGYSSAAILKFSPDGTLLWNRAWEAQIPIVRGPTYDGGYSLAVDNSGNIFLSGITWDYNVSPNHDSIFVVKFDSSGNFLWNRNWAGPSEDEAWGTKTVRADAAGNVYIAGRTASQCNSTNFGTCDFDVLVLKLDANGNFVWSKTWKASTGYDTATSFDFDPSGNLVITGTKDEFGTTAAPILLRIDPNGNLLSSMAWSGGPGAVGSAVTVDPSGDVFVAGSAPNNVGSWQSFAGTFGTENGTLTDQPSNLGIAPFSPVSQTGTITSPAGVIDSGGGGQDAFVSAIPPNYNPPAEQPVASVSPSPLNFPNQTVNSTSGSLPITVTNTGTASLIITANPGINGTNYADFAIANGTTCTDGASISPGNSCVVEVTFTPSMTASESAAVLIYDNAAGSPQAVGLSGVGVSPSQGTPAASLSTAAIYFGFAPVGGTSGVMRVVLTNEGNGTLTFSSDVNATSPFVTSSDTCTGGNSILPAASCSVDVRVAPSAAGPISGILTFTDNASPGTQTVTLSAAGLIPFHEYDSDPPVPSNFDVDPPISPGCSSAYYGCALTSVASLLTTLDPVVTPDSLDEFLRSDTSDPGYEQYTSLNPPDYCNLNWWAIPAFERQDSNNTINLQLIDSRSETDNQS